MYYFYGKTNRGMSFVHCMGAVCISESVMGGSTVVLTLHINFAHAHIYTN